MALNVEDGTGIAGAESYASVAETDAYWTARPQDPLAAAWVAAEDSLKEGALRSASSYLDATYGQAYRGFRATWSQGLEWPRTAGTDDDGNALPVLGPGGLALPALPPVLKKATSDLAARAVSGPLVDDAERGERVKRERIEGAVEVEYMDGAPSETSFGFLAGLLGPVLNGSQGGQATWFWA